MKNITLVTILLLVNISIIGQAITFEEQTLLFEHPNDEDVALNYPFIPFDFNSDGITDYTGSTFQDQYAYKGLADGTFEELILNWSQRPIKIIDWDKDGDDDAVFERHISISDGNDKFQILNLGVAFGEKIADVGDLNNDSHYDFVTINRITFENNEVYVYKNNGDDTFEKILIADDEEFEVAILGDISLDGLDDIIYSGSSTYIGVSNGDGTFTINEEKFKGSDDDILLTDLDGDQYKELIILNNGVNIYKNDNGTILKSSETTMSNSSVAIKSGDFNGDGRNDLVSLRKGPFVFDIRLMTNDGDGNFDSSVETISSFDKLPFFQIPDSEIQRNNISVYDQDADGKLDIIYIDGTNVPNSIRWLRNNTIISSTTDVTKEDHLKLYPNPTTDLIKFDLDIKQFSKFEIIDLKGRLIKKETLDSNEISISSLASGNYIFILYSIEEQNNSISGNFFKQ